MIDFNDAPDSFSGGSRFSFGGPEPVREADLAFLQALNAKQKEATLITDGPLIVLAGAGSGKTKMLTSRIAYLIAAKQVAPFEILAMTFTNKAAGEMRERVERALGISEGRLNAGYGYSYATPEIGTFHSVCVRLLRRELQFTPFQKPFVIYDDSDQLSLIKGVCNKLGIDDKSMSPKSFQGAINRLKCDALEPEDLQPEPYQIFEKKLQLVYSEYQKALFANQALDFGEILTLSYKILRDHPELRKRYQKRWKYIHVDEYQDTNRAQYLLLSMLAKKEFGGLENICVVGDEDQSIYKWRGADIRNILDFEKDYPGAQVVKLEQNYRSTKTIIQAASQVISNNTARKDKTLWTDNDQGLPIVHAKLADDRAEAEMVVGEIKKLSQDDGRAHGDFSIFYRTNAQSRSFEDILRRENIPYQIVGGLRFYDRKEIKDVLAYFKVIQNPDDSVNLKRIINTPARGIGKTTIEKLEAAQGVDESLWTVLKRASLDSSMFSGATGKKLYGFTQLMDRLIREQAKLLPSELFHLILDDTGYVRELKAENTDESLARIDNLEELDNVLKEFEEINFEKYLDTPEGRILAEDDRAKVKAQLLPQFLEQTSLASDRDALNEYASSVKMMTLHSSKGLEFPVVFMVGMEEGLFPSIKAWEEVADEDIEEERRLCYVGMTRARELLYMSSVQIRRVWGDIKYQEQSRFFAEIPGNLLQVRDFSFGRRAQGLEPTSVFSSHNHRSAVRSAVFTGGGAGNARDDVGRKIMHPEYGPGTVLASEGAGEDQKITVEFKGRVQKKFIRRYVAEFLRDGTGTF